MSSIQVAQLFAPYHLWRDPIYGAFIQRTTLSGLIAYAALFALLEEALSQGPWLLLALIAAFLAVSSMEMIIASAFLGPVLILPFFVVLPSGLHLVAMLVLAWGWFFISHRLAMHPMRPIGWLPLFALPLASILLMTTTVGLLSNIPMQSLELPFASLGAINSIFPEGVLLGVFITTWLDYRISFGSATQDNPDLVSELTPRQQGVGLLLRIMVSMPLALMVHAYRLYKHGHGETLVIRRGSLAQPGAAQLLQLHLQRELCLNTLLFQNPLIASLDTFVLYIPWPVGDSMKQIEVTFSFSYEHDEFVSLHAVAGPKPQVEELLQFLDGPGNLAIARGYSRNCRRGERLFCQALGEAAAAVQVAEVDAIDRKLKAHILRRPRVESMDERLLIAKGAELDRVLQLKRRSLVNPKPWLDLVAVHGAFIAKVSIDTHKRERAATNRIRFLSSTRTLLMQSWHSYYRGDALNEDLLRTAVNKCPSVIHGLNLWYYFDGGYLRYI